MKTVNFPGFLLKMKIKNALLLAAPLAAAILVLTACQNEAKNEGTSLPVSVTGVSLEDMDLTIFSSRRITPAFEPANATNKRVTWSSNAPDVVSVSNNGTVTALKFTDTNTYTGQAEITVTTEDGDFTDTCVVTVTITAQENITSLPPLKWSFRKYFMMGNIFDPGDVTSEEPYTINKPWLTRHYNILTHQNNMKPSYMCNATRGQYNANNIATAKRMITAARANDIKIQGHCLLWHSQLPAWQNNLRTSADTQEQVLGYMKEYITYIVNEFKGSIYAWDVLNEVFPDSVSSGNNWRDVMRNSATEGNPWYIKLGADFVYEGFLAARQADPDTILYYNDYNLDNVGKATMVRNMVRDVNAKYAQEHPEAMGRKLIEGIGMQSHHNADVTAAAIKNTLNLFRPLGVKISISELDLLAQTYNDYDPGRKTPTNAALLKQANQYGDYFKVFLDNSDIIERVTFWGVSDVTSWRSSGKPLPFTGERDGEGWSASLIPESIKAKPAYYKIIEALENY